MLIVTDMDYKVKPQMIYNSEYYLVQDTDDLTEEKIIGRHLVRYYGKGIDFHNVFSVEENNIPRIQPLNNHKGSMIDFKGHDGCIVFLSSLTLVVYAGGYLFEIRVFGHGVTGLQFCNDGFIIRDVIVRVREVFSKIQDIRFKFSNMPYLLNLDGIIIEGKPCTKSGFMRGVAMYGFNIN